MGIALAVVSKTGIPLSYGRVIGIEVDFQTKEAKVVLGGYTHQSRRNSETPVPVLSTSYIMPEPPPENLVGHAYEQLAMTYTNMDFTEV